MLLGTRRALLGRKGQNAAIAPPYSVDFSALPDGALPSPWVGATWAVSGGAAVCTPVTYGAELLTDPGLEANYTAGQCDSLTVKVGAPTLNQSADVHGGSKAQEFTAIAAGNELRWASIAGQGNKWLLMSAWGKRTAGANSKDTIYFQDAQGNANLGWVGYYPSITDAAYTQKVATRLAAANDVRLGVWHSGAAGTYDTVIMDDGSVKALTLSELVSAVLCTTADVTVKAGLTGPIYVNVGVVARLDDPANPANFLIAFLAKTYSNSNTAILLKCVNGVYAKLVTGFITYGAGRVLEIRCSGTSVELWYNNLQVGTTQTVDEATINSNKYHGLFSTNEGSSVASFFCHRPGVDRAIYLGGSNTETGAGTAPGTGASWRVRTDAWLQENVTFISWNKGSGGTDSWYGLIRLAEDVIANAPTHLFVEFGINDGAFTSGGGGTARANGWFPCQEALIRRVRTALPDCKIVFVNLVQQEEYSPESKILSRDSWEAICTKYSVPSYRIDLWLQDVIGTPTPTEEQCEVYGDTVHFTDAGHEQIYLMLEPHFGDWFPYAGGGWTGDLGDYDPPYYDDVADFEGDSIIRTGVDNDGETGTGWADSGTARQSSTADDTISWTGTMTAFGLDVTAQVCAFSWSVDGGAFTQVNVTGSSATIQPLYSLARDAHTVTIKVVSGTVKINRFLAV